MTTEAPPRAPNSRPVAQGTRPNGENRLPTTQPPPRKSRSRLAVLIAAVVILALGGGIALNAPRFGLALGGSPQPTAAPTSTLQPTTTATAAPTNTAGPQPTATQTQQQVLNQQAYASYRSVISSTFADGSCSSGNNRTTFASGQGIYVNLCTSGRAVSAPMTIAIRQNGQTVYTLVYGRYISPSASYYYFTSHIFDAGTYDVLVTLNINGTTAVARDLPLTIK